ncbi:MAG: hypothetical protein ACO1QR_13575 [Chthoniobacteraceae bacterium]
MATLYAADGIGRLRPGYHLAGMAGGDDGFPVCFAALAALAAALSRRRAFIALSTVQAGMLGIAVFHFVRQSQLPTGG